jgi:NADP-dependent 3-hydroxy acid dehydrogenase YdfG
MSTASSASPLRREPELAGQTVVVIGGSAGIGLETARLARAEGAALILVGRDADRLHHAANEIGAQSSAAFDATDFTQLERFFNGLQSPIDHVLVTGPGPYYAALADFDFDRARKDVEAHLFLPMQVARLAAKKVRPPGTLLFMGGTGGRQTGPGMALMLGDQLDARREQLRKTLPVRRVIGPADIAALAVHLMTNTALTGGTYDIETLTASLRSGEKGTTAPKAAAVGSRHHIDLFSPARRR